MLVSDTLCQNEITYHQIVSLLAANCHRTRNLLITADSERADSEAGLPINRDLRCQLLQHLKGALKYEQGYGNGHIPEIPTFAAFCNLSPDSPTAMFRTSLLMRISRMSLTPLRSACLKPQPWSETAPPLS